METVFFYGTLMTPFNRTGRLNLDQQILSNQIDHIAVDPDLDVIARSGVPPFQRGVERLLSQGPYVGQHD